MGRGKAVGLVENELAFYDGLRTNEAAAAAMQDDTMKKIAHELTLIVRRDAKTDWIFKEQVRVTLRTAIKHLLLRYDYPPDAEPTATKLILRQAEVMAAAEVS
jgi:type I restriction enzyme R subunit